jgi:hypothetical protein
VILCIDGSYLLHRARFVSEKEDECCWDYISVAFMKSLIATSEMFKPSKVYVLFDRGRSSHRLEIFRDYKAHRPDNYDDPCFRAYQEARDFLAENISMLGFISVLKDRVEADDFAHLIASQSSPGVHVTEDRDWYLNLFPEWSIYQPRAGNTVTYDDFVYEHSGDENSPYSAFLIQKALTGDKSDNIPGVTGIGPKLAKKFAPLILNRKPLEGRGAQLIEGNMSTVRRNYALMDPRWTLKDQDIIDFLKQAEERAWSHTNWTEFSRQFPPGETRVNLMGWWNRYKQLTRNFNDV